MWIKSSLKHCLIGIGMSYPHMLLFICFCFVFLFFSWLFVCLFVFFSSRHFGNLSFSTQVACTSEQGKNHQNNACMERVPVTALVAGGIV